MSKLHIHVGIDYRVISENFYMSGRNDDTVSFFIFCVIILLICCLIILQSKPGRGPVGFGLPPGVPPHLQASLLPGRENDMMSCYWEQPRPVAPRHDPSRPYAEQYRIDAPAVCTPVPACLGVDLRATRKSSAERTFRLLDENMDHLIESQSLLWASLYDSGSFPHWVRTVWVLEHEKGIVKQACPLNEADLWLTRWDFGTLKSLCRLLVTALSLAVTVWGGAS